MKKPLTILGIETSCDETAAAVISNGRIKSSVIASQAQMHNQFGGVVPEVAAREHVPAMIPTIDLAIKQAGVKLSEIDLLAVTQGPGLITSLMVGVDTSKALALALDKPLVPINHLEAHIYANFVGKFKIQNLKFKIFPALTLIVSGGHTMLVLMKNHGDMQIVGETLDDAAGEAFDKSAKLLGLGYPGGPALSKLAKQGSPNAFDLPRPMIKSDNLDFSFSGLKTAVLYTVPKVARSSKKWDSEGRADLAASVQQAIVDVLIAKTAKAVDIFKPKTIMLGGGVAANKPLRQRFAKLAKQKKIACSIPKFEYCTDNAAMIALAAYYKTRLSAARFPLHTIEPDPNLKLK